jgi:hypothetical protein
MSKQIIINPVVPTPLRKGRELQSVVLGECFNAFVDSQKAGALLPSGKIRKKGITAEGAVNLRNETSDILAHCNAHSATDQLETTHLVVGYVQSGKTMSFTALTALAKDNGYRIVIYLAGTKTNLLEQTADRLEKDLIKTLPQFKGHFKIHTKATINEAPEILGHLKLSSKPTILIPLLKHYKHINWLCDMLKQGGFKHLLEEESVLIIDDEADQASLNSYGRKNDKLHLEDEEKLMSSTYASILRLRSLLPGNSYVQYTATPQANILISLQDLLSPRSHTLLTPGEGYIGGKLFFGKGENHELFNGGLINQIPESEVFHKKRNPVKTTPKSLISALMLHILAVAIVVKYLKVEGVDYLSMMVHIDNEKKYNKLFKKWIDELLGKWSDLLAKPDGYDDKAYLLQDFKKLLPYALEFYPTDINISFDNIAPLLADVINDKKVYLINSDKDAQTTVEWDKYCMHILVGAEMLNRGFTVEKLATTYMPRYSISATNADTIQQRCRFFGYKGDYIQSCRVFLPKQAIEHYMEYVDHEEELRSILAQCDTLAESERKLMLSPRLRPTRANVLPEDIVNSTLKGLKVYRAFDPIAIPNNDSTVHSFLARFGDKLDEFTWGGSDVSNKHRGFKLSVEDALEFLSGFQFKNPKDAIAKAAAIRYLRYLSKRKDNPLRFVYFVQMSYLAELPGNELRSRPLNVDTGDLDSYLLQGHTSSYEGDSKMVGADSITLQLHHIKFKNPLPLTYPKEAYTLAINYPESLATSYVASSSVLTDE